MSTRDSRLAACVPPLTPLTPRRAEGERDEPCAGAALTGAPAPELQPQQSQPGPLAPLPPSWFREHVERLWRVVARLGVPAHSVDDVVQEAFITASRRRADIGPGQERSFLVATAIRLSANYRQKAHVRREVSEAGGFEHAVSPAPDAERLLIAKRLRLLLDEALGQLSELHRVPFVLYELEGFTVPEIAELLELPAGTVSSRLWRARAKFTEIAAALEPRAGLEKP